MRVFNMSKYNSNKKKVPIQNRYDKIEGKRQIRALEQAAQTLGSLLLWI